MFDNNTGIFKNKYRLELGTVIDAICNIAFDIGVQIDDVKLEEGKEIEYAKELFADDIFEHLKIRKIDLEQKDTAGNYIVSKKDFFSEISNYYNESIFNNESVTTYLEDSDILFINKSATFFYALEGNATDRIIQAIKSGKLLPNLISYIKNDKIKYSLNSINLFEHIAFYSNTIKVKKENQPVLPFMDFKLINPEKVKVDLENLEDYWINTVTYRRKYGIEISNDVERFIVSDKDDNGTSLGILIGDCFLPYENHDLLPYINQDYYLQYFWLLFQHTYSGTANKTPVENNSIGEFKKNFNNTELNQLLSNLKNNLYLDESIEISAAFEVFFNKVAMIEKLEFLDEYEFLISQGTEDATALGIYSKKKKGTSYNLLHWLKHEEDKRVTHFRGNVPQNKGVLQMSTLKPEICFYFLEKYFEDLIESILKNNGYNYLSNIRLNINRAVFCEIDFLINTNNKLYYIEAKTKLSKFYIDEFLKKSSKMIKKFQTILDKGIEIEFILLGGYSDDDVKDYQYFVNTAKQQTEKGYNVLRENLKTMPYYFNVPIPNIEGMEIICIAEPEYQKLNQLILQICPK